MQSIHVSQNRRFLVTADGKPFFWLADTAWELFHRCTLEQAEMYLENRRQKGFNVILSVALPETDGLRNPNMDGEVPFFDLDPLRPNEIYFHHIDTVIDLAAQKGMYVALLPTWGDKVSKQWGGGPVIFDVETASRYGEWIGARYRNARNLLWVNGGDRPISSEGISFAPVWRALATGIQQGVGGYTFMTYHPNGGCSSADVFHADEWLDMNMWQSGHSQLDAPNWDQITQDYRRTPAKPVLDGEPNYEDHPIDPFSRTWEPSMGYFRDYDVRKQAYRAVFAGACGHTYGHHSVWQMFTSERAPINYPDRAWQEALDRPGAYQVGYLRQLLESRPYLNRIPDQSLLASGEGEGSKHIRATRADDGSYAMIYVPGGWQTIEVNTQALTKKSIHVSWFNPRTGQTESTQTINGGGSARFVLPSSHEDWVLLLD